MVRTFVIVEALALLLQVNLNNLRINLLFIMDCLHKSKYIPTRIDPTNRILPTIVAASSVIPHSDTPHIINTIKLAITITTTNSCQSNVLISKRKLK